MRRLVLPGLLAAWLLLSGGCNEPFSPEGPYREHLVVYAILSGQTDTQYVRVYTTYNPSNFNPQTQTTDTPVLDALVTLSDGSTTVALHDTVVQRTDSVRYGATVHAYVRYRLPMIPGKTYTISVQSPTKGTATATTTAPDNGIIAVGNTLVFNTPANYPGDDILLNPQLSETTRGFLVRIFLVYQSNTNIVDSIEVPQTIVTDAQGDHPVYPKLARGADIIPTIGPYSADYTFTHVGYVYAVNQAKLKYADVGVKFQNVTIILIQLDTPLYDYYNIVNGFQDEFSIRSDQPDYSNIVGGVGVFGSFNVNSYALPVSSSIE